MCPVRCSYTVWQSFSNFPSSLHVQQGMFSQSPPCALCDACGGELAGENLYHMLPDAVMDGFAGSAPRVPCPASVLFPVLTPAYKPKLYFTPREQRCPVASKLVMIGYTGLLRVPPPSWMMATFSIKGKDRWGWSETPPHTLRRWERRAFSCRDDYIIPFRHLNLHALVDCVVVSHPFIVTLHKSIYAWWVYVIVILHIMLNYTTCNIYNHI